MTETLLIAKKCPSCGAPIGPEAIGCAFCGGSFDAIEKSQKPTISVKGEGDKPQIGGVEFDRRIKFTDEQLEAIAVQVTAGMVATETEPAKRYLGFSLPLPPTSGRPPALFVEAHRIDDVRFKVLFVSDDIPDLHESLREKGRVLNFPPKII